MAHRNKDSVIPVKLAVLSGFAAVLMVVIGPGAGILVRVVLATAILFMARYVLSDFDFSKKDHALAWGTYYLIVFLTYKSFLDMALKSSGAE